MVVSVSMDEAFRSGADGVLAGLADAERELALAIEHDKLMSDELAAGDFAQVLRHAEHVVNIWTGRTALISVTSMATDSPRTPATMSGYVPILPKRCRSWSRAAGSPITIWPAAT